MTLEDELLRNTGPKIGKFTLPSIFIGCTMINNVAVSKIKNKYAVIRDDDIIFGDIPEDGKLDVDGVQMVYNNSRILEYEELPDEIDMAFDGRDNLTINDNIGDITFGISKDDLFHVKGYLLEKPIATNIRHFTGQILVPFNSNFYANIRNGDVKGTLYAIGNINVINGNVHANYSGNHRLMLKCEGKETVYGMTKESLFYCPTFIRNLDLFSIECTGDVTINYTPIDDREPKAL
ncbi:hypothetical protein KY334_07730 [Candidatus Woesearchaeota archaeon]|nr:hypothetical protein [Candidatus Woesearchaeota archaeon]